ncbi:hypothetical protein QJS66_03030 [Kocuria rhizophila]|nr:hypothetical protein QJS66_03030 [Kocuria rhizophila]
MMSGAARGHHDAAQRGAASAARHPARHGTRGPDHDRPAGPLPRGRASRADVAVPGILVLCVLSSAFSGQGIQSGLTAAGVLRGSRPPSGRSGLIAGKLLAVMAVLAVQYVIVAAVAFWLGWHPPSPPYSLLPARAGCRGVHRAGPADRRNPAPRPPWRC